jgi:DNA-binding NarL/FixJ family response regulator
MTAENPIRCLVVDDHPLLRDGLVTMLDAEDDIEVVGQAADGDEALALAERRSPDVAIIDVRMPGKTGVDVCRELGERRNATPVVLYTAFDDVDLLDAGLEAGARGFVLKTGPPPDILQALRTVARGQPYIDAALTGALLQRRGDKDRNPLSQREREVLQLLADGMTTDRAAEQLFLSPTTVRSYAESGMHKLAARSRTHAVAEALRLRLID